MDNKGNISFANQTMLALGFLCVLIFGAYSNTFQSSWHLDDFPTLVHDSALHLEDLSASSIAATFYSRPGSLGKSYRPVSCLSLALNWYLGGDQVAGYHLVNISIHFFTAFFLYLTIYNIFQSPRMAVKNSSHVFYIAILSAALWALNPVQTQAVTYIVQRMASLAAMFFTLGMYFYVKGRISKVRWYQIFNFIAGIGCYALAVWSKENAIMLPLAVMLVEIVFFQNLDSEKTCFKIRVGAASIAILLLFIFIYVVYFSNDFSILKGYRHRAFTLGQRLLTEPRIIIFYLSLLFYPMHQRLSIEHPVELSTSLLQPWTTVPAIAFTVLMIGIGLYQIKKRPILAFALLFFYLNHLIESTVLPLELVFEHRNYLPSLFLFCPVAVGLFGLVDYYQQKSGSMVKVLVSFMVLLVLGLGLSTYVRNMAWATEQTLWEDALKKAPGRARPAYNLAKHYANAGQLDIALQLYQKALATEASRRKYTRALSLNGIASIYYMKRDFEKALEYCQKALKAYPGFETARYNLVLVLSKLARWDELSHQIDLLLAGEKTNRVYLFLKGEILLQQNQPARALPYFRKALQIAPDDNKIQLNIGIALNLIGHFQQAEWFFRRVKNTSPTDIRPYVYLIQIGMTSEDPAKTGQYIDELITSYKAATLAANLKTCFDTDYLSHRSRKLICSAVHDRIKNRTDEMARMGEN